MFFSVDPLSRKDLARANYEMASSLRVAENEKEKLYPLRSSSQKRLSEGCRLQIMGGALALARERYS